MRCKLEAIGGTIGQAEVNLIPLNPWAARYNTWLLMKGIVLFFSFSPPYFKLKQINVKVSYLELFEDMLYCLASTSYNTPLHPCCSEQACLEETHLLPMHPMPAG